MNGWVVVGCETSCDDGAHHATAGMSVDTNCYLRLVCLSHTFRITLIVNGSLSSCM